MRTNALLLSLLMGLLTTFSMSSQAQLLTEPESLAPPPAAIVPQETEQPGVPVVVIKETAIDFAPAALSLQDAVDYTFTNNPRLKAARSEVLATQERLPQALAGWKPTVRAEASVSKAEIEGSNFGGGYGSTAKDGQLLLDQPLYRGGRTLAGIKVAKNIITAQRALLESTEQEVLLNAVTVYMDILRDQAVLDLAQNDADVLRQQLEATRTRFEFGELTKTDVAQAEARLARAESTIIQAKGNLKVSEAAFLNIVGQQPTKLIPPELELPIPQTIEEAFVIADTSNPRTIAAQSTHQAAKNDVENIFGELLPEVGFFGSWNRTYDPQPGILDEQTTQTVGISASVPLYEAGGTRSRIRAAKNVTNQRYMEIIETKRQVRQEITQSWENLQTAHAAIVAREAQAEAAALAEEGTKKEAEFGSRTILDMLDAQQEHLDARVALVTAQRDETVARFSLLKSIGTLTPQTLGLQTKTINYDKHLDEIQRKIFDTDVDRLE